MHFHIAATICRKDCLALFSELAKLYSRKKKEVRDTKKKRLGIRKRKMYFNKQLDFPLNSNLN